MNCFVLFKKQFDTLIEQTKSHPQETLRYKMNKPMETYTFNPLIKLNGEAKWL